MNMHNPTTSTNFSIAQFQHEACTGKVHTRCPSIQSRVHLQPPTLAIYNCLLFYILLQVVAMLLFVAVNKSSVQSMKFTRNLINNCSLECSQGVVVLHMCSNIILNHVGSPLIPAQYLPIQYM